MFRSICFFVGFLAAANFVNAQGGMGGDRETSVPRVEKESLILAAPNKWLPYYKESDQKVDTYYFPEGQQPRQWDEAIKYERYLGTQGITAASQVYELRSQSSSASCPDHEIEVILEEEQNGYSTVLWTENCVSETGEIATLNKVVLGNEQLYVISKIWKSEAKRKDMEKWQEFMQQTYVCDPTTGSNPCERRGSSGNG